jgi:hypothetical protein
MVVCVVLFMNETARRFADVVLPGTGCTWGSICQRIILQLRTAAFGTLLSRQVTLARPAVLEGTADIH